MEANWQTFGHENIKRIFNLQLASGSFSHAYLLFGMEGVGKKTLCLEFAGKILATTNPASHVDFSLLDQEQEITMEQIKNFMAGLRGKPFVGKKKVAIINNAELLNAQSSNALLKTLEEPSPSTVLILISSHKGLLPTIISRCQTFACNPFTSSQLKAYAKNKAMRLDDAAYELCFGQIKRLYELSDATVLKKQQNLFEEFREIQEAGRAERLLAIAKFAELEDTELSALVRQWMLWYKDTLALQPKKYRPLAALLGAYEDFRTNKNKKLILQSLFLSLNK